MRGALLGSKLSMTLKARSNWHHLTLSICFIAPHCSLPLHDYTPDPKPLKICHSNFIVLLYRFCHRITGFSTPRPTMTNHNQPFAGDAAEVPVVVFFGGNSCMSSSYLQRNSVIQRLLLAQLGFYSFRRLLTIRMLSESMAELWRSTPCYSLTAVCCSVAAGCQKRLCSIKRTNGGLTFVICSYIKTTCPSLFQCRKPS